MNPAYNYICEARAPGRPPHTFGTVDADTASAMCDANGWEFVRIFQPGTDSDRPAAAVARGADRALTGKQRKALLSEARKTWDALSALGVTDQTFEAWRHAVVYTTVRRKGIRYCASRHYTILRRTFRELRGESAGYKSAARRQSGEAGDTMERREQVMHRIAQTLGEHARRVEDPQSPGDYICAAAATLKGGPLTESYMLAIARNKNRAEPIEDTGDLLKLPVSKLEHLLWTLINRIAAREGRGTPQTRNKGQRKNR